MFLMGPIDCSALPVMIPGTQSHPEDDPGTHYAAKCISHSHRHTGLSFYGIGNHADLWVKEQAALGSLSHTETGHIACSEQLGEGYRKSPPC